MRQTVTLFNPQQGHSEIANVVWPAAKALLMAGRRVVIEMRPEVRSVAQNRRYWGRGVLAQIAEQAVVNGRSFSAKAWHEHMKQKFLGLVELEDGRVVGMSSTKLTTAEFRDFCDQVEAYAATELGVTFHDLQEHA